MSRSLSFPLLRPFAFLVLTASAIPSGTARSEVDAAAPERIDLTNFPGELVDKVVVPYYYDTIRGDSGKTRDVVSWSPDIKNPNVSQITMSKDYLAVRDVDGKVLFVQADGPDGPKIILNELRQTKSDPTLEKKSPDGLQNPTVYGFSMPR